MNSIEREPYLIQPTIDYKNEYISFYKEWKSSGEIMIPFTITKDPMDFQKMLEYLSDCEKGIEPKIDWIPANSTYWLIDEFEVIGAVNIRHYLTEKLLNNGGHIGYGIRPSKRSQGYATKILALSLMKAKELGIDRALLVCEENNTASEKTILKNGGIADIDFVDEKGNIFKRYWIETEKH